MNDKNLFIPATVYTAGNNVNKQWHVSYSYWTDTDLPKPGYKRFKVYEEKSIGLVKGNSISNFNDKINFYGKLATFINNKLSRGWSPYGNSYAVRHNTKFMCIDEALNNIIAYKKQTMADTSYKSFKSHVLKFKQWLINETISYFKCSEIEKKHIAEFLYSVQLKGNLSNRTFNNYLIDIKSTFTMMLDEFGYITDNPAKNIQLKQTKSEKHNLFTDDLLSDIAKYLEENDPYLKLFCRFIWLGFRPIEIVKLKVSDVNLQKNIITISESREKTGDKKYRTILKLFKNDIDNMELAKYPKHYFLFSALKRPAEKGTSRDYFTDKFMKVKKHFKLDKNYTMYGLRHTMAVELTKKNVNLKNIIKITGHKTLDAYQKYIQKYLDEPAEDVSDQFTITI